MNYQCEKQSWNCFHLFLQLSQINQTVNISDKDQYCCVLTLTTNIIHSLIDFVQSFMYSYILIILMVIIMLTETEAAT